MAECAIRLKSQETEKLNFLPRDQGLYCQHLRYEKSDYCLSQINRNY